MRSIKSSEKKRILKQLNEQFGIKNLPYLLIRFGKDKIRAYSGNLCREEIQHLNKTIRIENLGLYFLNMQKDEARPTLDGVQLLRNQITKNIIELTDLQAKQWLQGMDLDIQTTRGYKILKHAQHLIGCGKSTTERITNFVPKERRIK
ncbi:hypothetical protein GOV14_01110 [Candidatus Pacearchaeota archaeon]|nr:hypothetical protein [Candidatus Pacearchaeota archaeon]